MTYEDIVSKSLTWDDVIKHFEPKADDARVLHIYQQAYFLAHDKVGADGDKVTAEMIFNEMNEHYNPVNR